MSKIKPKDQVFINCPFDGRYVGLFRACVFTILDGGFIPRCSKEVDDALQFRLSVIMTIMRECRYGIHDISRVELDTDSRLPLFNMPFELGMFYSAKHFGGGSHSRKQCLILERDKYRYQKFISDISGIDVTPHKNNEKALILALRNWLATTSRRTNIPPGASIQKRFKTFQLGMRRECRKRDVEYDTMTFFELVGNMTDWLKLNEVAHVPFFWSSFRLS